MVVSQRSRFDETAYKRWLIENTTLAGRSVGDAVSRTRRVLDMVDLSRAYDADQVHIALLGNSAFKACSLGVRSQLKRAANLYVQFRQVDNA